MFKRFVYNDAGGMGAICKEYYFTLTCICIFEQLPWDIRLSKCIMIFLFYFYPNTRAECNGIFLLVRVYSVNSLKYRAGIHAQMLIYAVLQQCPVYSLPCIVQPLVFAHCATWSTHCWWWMLSFDCVQQIVPSVQ